jgi:hypothetical protein
MVDYGGAMHGPMPAAHRRSCCRREDDVRYEQKKDSEVQKPGEAE